VCGLYRENGDAIGFRILNKIRRVPVNIQFSYAEFDGDFPGGRYAQVHGVGTVADDLASGSRQPRVAAEKPNSGVGASEATDLADRTPRARTAPAAVTVCYVKLGHLHRYLLPLCREYQSLIFNLCGSLLEFAPVLTQECRFIHKINLITYCMMVLDQHTICKTNLKNTTVFILLISHVIIPHECFTKF